MSTTQTGTFFSEPPKKKRPSKKLLDEPEQGSTRAFYSLPPSRGKAAFKTPPAAIRIEPTVGGRYPFAKTAPSGYFRSDFYTHFFSISRPCKEGWRWAVQGQVQNPSGKPWSGSKEGPRGRKRRQEEGGWEKVVCLGFFIFGLHGDWSGGRLYKGMVFIKNK